VQRIGGGKGGRIGSAVAPLGFQESQLRAMHEAIREQRSFRMRPAVPTR
jgi:hypothetical protein